LRIRDVYVYDFVPSRIPDSNFYHPGSWIRIKELKYFSPKKWFPSYRKYNPNCSYRIRIPDPDHDFTGYNLPAMNGSGADELTVRALELFHIMHKTSVVSQLFT
jgi:hypothetical protein